jgi:hypothetical protein
MATGSRLRLKEIQSKVRHANMGASERSLLVDLCDLLSLAVFLDDLPKEQAYAITQLRDKKEETDRKEGAWRRGYKCRIHGPITAPLCGDCASEGTSPSANVTNRE